jgi:hypothetical protein
MRGTKTYSSSKACKAFTWLTTDTPIIQVALGLILSTQAQSILFGSYCKTG